MANYQVWLGDGAGNRKIPLAPKLIDLSRSVNSTGKAKIITPLNFDTRLLQRDGWLEVWRKTRRGINKIEIENVWLLDSWTEIDGKYLELNAGCLNTVLEERIVAYTSGSLQADKTGAADTLAVAVALENLSVSASDSARRIDPAVFSVGSAAGIAPSITEALSQKTVMEALKAIASNSESKGRKLFFDMVYIGPKQIRFRVYLDRRGQDRTTTALRFSSSSGTLKNVRITVDYSAERNFIYALGQGGGSSRMIKTAQNADSIAASVFGRKEKTVSASAGNVTATSLQNDADSAIADNKPRVYLEADLEDSPQTSYGDDWYFGDTIKVVASDRVFTCNIDAVSVHAEGQKEKISAKLRGEIV